MSTSTTELHPQARNCLLSTAARISALAHGLRHHRAAAHISARSRRLATAGRRIEATARALRAEVRA